MDYKEYSDNELCSMICESDEEAKDILLKKYSYIINVVIKKYIMASLKLGIEYNDLYQEESPKMRKQKEALLSSDTSLKTFNKLVNDRVNGSFKTKLKNRILDTKLYSIYHFHAKYYKTKYKKK